MQFHFKKCNSIIKNDCLEWYQKANDQNGVWKNIVSHNAGFKLTVRSRKSYLEHAAIYKDGKADIDDFQNPR